MSSRPPARSASRAARLAFLLKPGWIAAILGAIAFAVLCVTVLAPWQFGRHDDRSSQNHSIEAAVTAGTVGIDELLPAGDAAGVGADKAWRSVEATGTFLGDTQVSVRLRQNNAGERAFEVLVPLQLDDGSILLVDRGYVREADLPDGQAPPAPPSGTVTVTGRLQAFQPDPLHRDPQQVGERSEVYGIAADSITGLPGPVRNGFVQLANDSPGVLSAINVPQVESGPYLSYAWQWLVFGSMGLIAVGFFIVREYRDPRDPADDSTDAGGQDHSPDSNPAADSTAGHQPARAEPVGARGARRKRGFDRSELYDP